MENFSWKIFGDGCVSHKCLYTTVARPTTQTRARKGFVIWHQFDLQQIVLWHHFLTHENHMLHTVYKLKKKRCCQVTRRRCGSSYIVDMGSDDAFFFLFL
jgi:hypothetical protein